MDSIQKVVPELYIDSNHNTAFYSRDISSNDIWAAFGVALVQITYRRTFKSLAFNGKTTFK